MNLTDVRKIASDLKIAGRSKMNKAELIIAIGDLFFDEATSVDASMIKLPATADSDEWFTLENDGSFTPVESLSDWMPTPVQSDAKPLKGTPMGSARRKDNYCRQNGCERLTAAQRRRLAKKAIRKLCNAL